MTTWGGCYAEGWGDFIVPEAFAHPAKVSLGLSARIYRHMLERGWLQVGMTVLDPFSGIGGCAFHALANGLKYVGVECEARFCALAEQNFDLWRRRWQMEGARIIHGDSRKLVELIGAAQGAVSSPPFAESLSSGKLSESMKEELRARGHKPSASGEAADYGDSPGQLGAMRPGEPPSGVISSPPYSEGLGHGGTPTRGCGRGDDRNLDAMQVGYGDSPSNLGNMPAGCVSSPPYDSNRLHDGGIDEKAFQEPWRAGGNCQATTMKEYGSSDGQIGNGNSGTFWGASKTIMEQLHQVLAPGSYAAWIVKRFVRDGAIVPFPDQWLALCESTGFEFIERVQASLVTETREPCLFDGERVKRSKRVSFFRRLHEKKRPDLAIDHEDVLFVRRAP